MASLDIESTSQKSLLSVAASSHSSGLSHIPDEPSAPHLAHDLEHAAAHGPRRWFTLEFFIYYAIIAYSLYTSVTAMMALSSPSHPCYAYFYRFLSRSSFGMIDNSDGQLKDFKNNLPLLFGLCIAYSLSKFVVLSLVQRVQRRNRHYDTAYEPVQSAQRHSHSRFDSRVESASDGPLPPAFPYRHVANFHAVASTLIILVVHGPPALIMFSAMVVQYGLTKLCKGHSVGPWLTWTWALFLLWTVDWTSQFRFSAIGLGWLDSWHGFFPRWYVIFKISLLRMISFSMDYHLSFRPLATEDAAMHAAKCVECRRRPDRACDRRRCLSHHPNSDFNLLVYFGYTLYLPLYFSGPVLTFNHYLSQLKSPSSQISWSATLLYGLRFLFLYALLEWMGHSFYAFAVIRAVDIWDKLTPLEIVCTGYWSLMLLWLKLTSIWRFARWTARLDGLDTIENMGRCMMNHVSGLGFWRAWHCSFNQWILRYVYIPLGGKQTAKYNIWIIFTFVALWHDKNLALLLWAWLICLFILPELLLSYLSRRLRLSEWRYYRIARGMAASVNLFSMTVNNMVGFTLGIAGIQFFLDALQFRSSWRLVFGMFISYYANANIVFEIREEERRRGIHKSY